jgi:acetolactate synthase-1/2/3 large subunit
MNTIRHARGADHLVDVLLANDIRTCFANPGTSEMHFVAALDGASDMRCVLSLFEGGATGAADGYYRMTGLPAATLLHLGPGLANGLANLHNAKKARSGIVNVVGEHATTHLALDAPLTSDIETLARPMSHWVGTVGHPGELRTQTQMACDQARSQPGRIATCQPTSPGRGSTRRPWRRRTPRLRIAPWTAAGLRRQPLPFGNSRNTPCYCSAAKPP